MKLTGNIAKKFSRLFPKKHLRNWVELQGDTITFPISFTSIIEEQEKKIE